MAEVDILTVLVTGGTGFVGRVVVARLLAAGHDVRLAVRSVTAVPPGVSTVQVGGIGPQTDWSEALHGVTKVVHLAARVHVMKDTADDPLAAFRLVNRDGTGRLAQSCRDIEHFVYMSSIKAVIDEDSDFVIDEHTAPQPTSPYGVSKLEGEQQLADAGCALGYSWTILRPPLVFGEQVRGNFERLMRLCRRGVPLPLASVHNRRSLIYVGNLAEAVLHGLEQELCRNTAIPLTDGPPHSTSDLIRAIAAAMGRRPRLIPFPTTILHALAAATRKEHLWTRLCANLEIAPEAARRALQWTPTMPFEEGIRRTVGAFLRER
jgi:nucleoside-diphosphate-sugar epimerase